MTDEKGIALTEPPEQTRKCSNCMWWDREGVVRGLCKAAPPSVTRNDCRGNLEPLWPKTRDRDWCGSFRIKEPGQ